TPALAGSAPEVLIGHVAAVTSGIRVGSGGVMLQHYSALKVAEAFRVLETLYPGRIDLGVGRAPGSDQLTARALGGTGAPEFFPQQVQDLLAFVHGELPPEHPFAKVRAMPTGPTVAEAEAHEYTAWERQIVEHARGRRVAGTPAECRERLEALAADYGVDEIVVVTITETPETRRRSYELLAQAFELPPR